MKISLSLLIFLFNSLRAEEKDHTQKVNALAGTDAHSHTFPGVTLPHGMIQLSPDTRTTTWDGRSGYHYSDRSIMGFSHIHYSGGEMEENRSGEGVPCYPRWEVPRH